MDEWGASDWVEKWVDGWTAWWLAGRLKKVIKLASSKNSLRSPGYHEVCFLFFLPLDSVSPSTAPGCQIIWTG